MNCPSCGKAVTGGMPKCPHCGSQLRSKPTPTEPGRGGLLIGLGVTSIVLLGPILGIPTWVMGKRDLRKIRQGIVPTQAKSMTKVGMILGIVGTFVSTLSLIIYGILLAIVLSLFAAKSIQANKDAIGQELTVIAKTAARYHSLNRGSFNGFRLPDRLKRTEIALYATQVLSPNEIRVGAVSVQNFENTIAVTIRGDASMEGWKYGGDFK